MKSLKLFTGISFLLGAFSFAHAGDFTSGLNKVNYASDGEKVAAHLFVPDGYVEGQNKYPAIIVTPPATGVKEQTAGIYAEKLSKKGFVTLAIDPRGFGESEGEPFLYNAYKITDDIRNGVSYLGTLDIVDKDNIFSVGICAGTGFSGLATAFDSRIKALAMISPFITTKDDFLEMFQGNSTIIRQKILPLAAQAAQKEYETGEATYGRLVPVTEQEIKTARKIPLGMRDYYLEGKPGDVPTWENKLNTRSYYYALGFSIFDYVDYFDGIPLFMAYGSDAASGPGAKKFYDLVQGEKEHMVLEGADHFEMYWKPEYVNPVIDGVAIFFGKYTK